MGTSLPNSGQRKHYSVRETAWILGVEQSTIARSIRLGTLRTEQRNGRRVIPARQLAQLLGEPVDGNQSGGDR